MDGAAKEEDKTMRYDVVCPICGTINRGLYLEDSDGSIVGRRGSVAPETCLGV